MKKNVLILGLAAVMTLSVFAGCKKDDAQADSTQVGDTATPGMNGEKEWDASTVKYPKNKNYPHIEELLEGKEVDTTYDNSKLLYSMLDEMAREKANPGTFSATPGVFKEDMTIPELVEELSEDGILEFWRPMDVEEHSKEEYIMLFTELENICDCDIYAVARDQKVLMSDGTAWSLSAGTYEDHTELRISPTGAIIMKGVDMDAAIFNSEYTVDEVDGTGRNIQMNYMGLYVYTDGKIVVHYGSMDEKEVTPEDYGIEPAEVTEE